ncbi:MAG TPA: hypothetical protein VIL30_05470 [Ramlibacter sp.]
MAIVKTDLGQQVLKDRSVVLTPRQRAALILCDGKRSEKDVLLATASMGVTREDMAHLRDLGLVASGAAPAAAPAPAPAAPAEAAQTTGERYLEAYQVATRLTSGLGLKGFRLNLAVEAASNFDDLVALAPRIRDAVGPEKYAPLEAALQPR